MKMVHCMVMIAGRELGSSARRGVERRATASGISATDGNSRISAAMIG